MGRKRWAHRKPLKSKVEVVTGESWERSTGPKWNRAQKNKTKSQEEKKITTQTQ